MSVTSIVNHCVMPKDMYLAKMWKSENVYIGNEAFQVVVSPASRKNGAMQYHIAALKDGEVIRVGDLNTHLYEVTIAKYMDELNERLANALEKKVHWVNTGNHDLYVSYGGLEQWQEGTSLKATALRIILMVKNVNAMTPEEEDTLRKVFKGELVEWMETIIQDRPGIETKKEDYVNDIVNIMDISMLPHDKETFNPVPVMTVLGMIFGFLGVYFSSLLVFQVCSLVVSAYAAYRAYQKDNKPMLFINIGIVLISLYLIYNGYVNS